MKSFLKFNSIWSQSLSSSHITKMQPPPSSSPDFKPGQRVHSAGDLRRIGTVRYVGPVEGYSGAWVGVDWDNRDGKHDGSLDGVKYFHAASPTSASFVRPHKLASGFTFLQALELRYRGISTQQEEDEMYVLSSSNKRVSVELVGKDKIQDKLSCFEELTSASVSYLGVASPGDATEIGSVVPNLREVDLTGNLISEWKDVSTICEQLPDLVALNLSYNLMSHDIVGLQPLKSIRILVLNNVGISWTEVEILKHSLPSIEELHLMANHLSTIEPVSSSTVEGFDHLRLLNLDDNSINDWNEILKLSQLPSLEQLHLNNNNLNDLFYPDACVMLEFLNGHMSHDKTHKPFQNLRCLLLGGNNIKESSSVDALNAFPQLADVRLSGNPVADPGQGGTPRYVLVARLGKVEILNGSEITSRERKESEIRYVRLVMSKHINIQEIKLLDPRFAELKTLHGIEDEKPLVGGAGPQKMATGLLSVTIKCVGASMGEKPSLVKKLPGTTTVGKLTILCETFFKLKSMKLKLFLQEEGSPLPLLLDDEMQSLTDLGIGSGSTILVDEDS